MSITARLRILHYIAASGSANHVGTFVAARPSEECRAAIYNWCVKHKIPGLVLPDFYHATLIKSEVPDLITKVKPLNFMVPQKRVSFKIYNHNLVLEFTSSSLNDRVKELREIETVKARSLRIIQKPHFPFNAHVTVSKHTVAMTPERLASLNAAWPYPLVFNHEYATKMYWPKALDYMPNLNRDDNKDELLRRRAKLEKFAHIRSKN